MSSSTVTVLVVVYSLFKDTKSVRITVNYTFKNRTGVEEFLQIEFLQLVILTNFFKGLLSHAHNFLTIQTHHTM